MVLPLLTARPAAGADVGADVGADIGADVGAVERSVVGAAGEDWLLGSKSKRKPPTFGVGSRDAELDRRTLGIGTSNRESRP